MKSHACTFRDWYDGICGTHTLAPLIFAVLLVTGPTPTYAADYTPWQEGSLPAPIRHYIELAQRQDKCCKHCTKGQPCGNTCISEKAKCKQPPGCAC